MSTRVGHAAIWTGRELIIWGGESYPATNPEEPAGAAYDPTTDAWRVLPEAPLQRRRGAVTAFTGTEVLVMAGLGDGDQPLADGAAYSPESDAWRPLPDSPLQGGGGLVGAWTGDEWIVVEAGTAVDPEQPSGEAAAYDPKQNVWRSLPMAPIPQGWASVAVWTGTELVVIRLAAEGGRGAGAQYDPETNEWTPVPPNPALSSETVPFAAWTGESVLLVRGPIQDADGLLEEGATLAYDPSNRNWQRSAGAPPSFFLESPAWTGAQLVFLTRLGSCIAYSPSTDRWTSLPPPPGRAREGWSATWTGAEVIFWGGTEPGNGFPVPDGAALEIPH